MLLFILVFSLAIAGIRLTGNTSIPFKTTAHIWSGFLFGYIVASHFEWLATGCLIGLCVVESYAFASKIFPALSIGNILKKINV